MNLDTVNNPRHAAIANMSCKVLHAGIWAAMALPVAGLVIAAVVWARMGGEERLARREGVLA